MQAFTYLSKHQWQLFDEVNNPASNQGLSALAYQDSFLRWIPEKNSSDSQETNTLHGALHFYPMKAKNVLLGAKDTRITKLDDANQHLRDQGYEVILRPHGGLAVVNDPGIFNLAMVTDNKYFPLSIDEAYEQMVKLVQLSLANEAIEVESYEIPTSYCPGKYDLVVKGLKIGGIAQRRFKTGITTAAYISVNGNQQQRGELLRDYYQIGQANEQYPDVDPNVMTTIEDVIHKPISIGEYKDRIRSVFQSYSTLTEGTYADEELHTLYQAALPKLITRNEKVQAK